MNELKAMMVALNILLHLQTLISMLGGERTMKIKT